MELTTDQRNYCYKVCPLGKAKSQELLDTLNSAYDAAMDMVAFVEKCAKTCSRCQNGEIEDGK